MSVEDELTTIQRCLDDMDRSIRRLEQRLGKGGLEVRRVRTDAGHLRESVALLRGNGAARPADQSRQAMVLVSDAPYDASLWKDAEDEGLGSRRHAP
ncbi:hypothetical protein [Streptomyces griseocarneus]|uniref:hypothetical protein n=1 Tax=Streptomyces griseocarneus TaxID=51201 RepID=UPI00167C480D|nr:hypothetical protein [Streptomyces griseocarneus]MBZ6476512.1 hypothetical protein [Streptomyces griseocarneus]GHG79942.1 hypothetical protein GCM10018779_61180 [Streptomyces griseocarneus]